MHEYMAAVAGVIPEPVAFALWWVGLGFLSCCSMGCGGAFLLSNLSELTGESGRLALLFYGVGSVLGEVPVYYISEELFRSERLALKRNRSTSPFLTSLQPLLASPYWPVLIYSTLSPFPIDTTAMLCAVLNVTFPDFILPTIVGKGLVRPVLLTMLFTSESFAGYVPVFEPVGEGIPETAFAATAAVLVVGFVLWKSMYKSQADIDLDD